MEGGNLLPGQQIDPLSSPRFSQIATFARLPITRDLNGVKALFVGIPFDDGTTFRTGSRFGPRAVREASRLLRRYNPFLDVMPFEKLGMIDYGDVDVVPGYIEDTYGKVQTALTPVFSVNVVPIVCGGDHSISLPVLRAASKRHGKLALVHYDAHSDCWDEFFGKKYNHGTTFKRALDEQLIDASRSIHIGLRGSVYDGSDMKNLREMGFSVVTMKESADIGVDEVSKRIREVARGYTYVSLDIDAVDPAYAPGTGVPEVGGFTSREILELVRELEGLTVIGFDLVEVSPLYDSSEITALLASNLIYEFCSTLAKSR